MLDKQLRIVKEEVLHPFATAIGAHLTPTQITALGGGIGLLSAFAGWHGCYVIGVSLWLLNRVVDGLDGTVARLFDCQSDLGAYIDILTDVVVYALIPIGLVVALNDIMAYQALIFMLAIFYINMASWTYLSSILEKRNRGADALCEKTSVTMPDGLIEGTETIIFYTLFFLFPQWLVWLFILMGVLVIITIIQRLIWAFKYLQ